MGANQSGGGGNAPVGTNFKQAQKDRLKYGQNDLPDIPLNKLKEVCAEVDMTVKQSKFLKEYKAQFRDALKRKKAKNHEPKLGRLYSKALPPADDAAGKDEDRKAMIKLLKENITPVVKDDIVDGFKEDGKDGNLDKQADDVIYKLIHERVHDIIHENANIIFIKYNQGKDYLQSDAEEEDSAALEEAKAERAREAAEQREYEAEVFLAELNGEEPPEKPENYDDDEEEEEEEDEE